jgi:hypothetical protein
MMKRSLVDAGHFATCIMEFHESRGRKFRPHAFETIVNSYEMGASEDKLTAMVEAYMIPQGIKMPWGTWVNP